MNGPIRSARVPACLCPNPASSPRTRHANRCLGGLLGVRARSSNSCSVGTHGSDRAGRNCAPSPSCSSASKPEKSEKQKERGSGPRGHRLGGGIRIPLHLHREVAWACFCSVLSGSCGLFFFVVCLFGVFGSFVVGCCFSWPCFFPVCRLSGSCRLFFFVVCAFVCLFVVFVSFVVGCCFSWPCFAWACRLSGSCRLLFFVVGLLCCGLQFLVAALVSCCGGVGGCKRIMQRVSHVSYKLILAWTSKL